MCSQVKKLNDYNFKKLKNQDIIVEIIWKRQNGSM